MAAMLHPEEEQRLAALSACGIMDTPREERYDRLVFQAAHICRTPIAAIGFLDRSRCWRKAFVSDNIKEMRREDSLCSHAILEAGLFKVADARLDPLFFNNVYVVGAPFICFFAAKPIYAHDGLPLGTLCVIDRSPRILTVLQERALQMLAQEAEGFLRATSATRIRPDPLQRA